MRRLHGQARETGQAIPPSRRRAGSDGPPQASGQYTAIRRRGEQQAAGRSASRQTRASNSTSTAKQQAYVLGRLTARMWASPGALELVGTVSLSARPRRATSRAKAAAVVRLQARFQAALRSLAAHHASEKRPRPPRSAPGPARPGTASSAACALRRRWWRRNRPSGADAAGRSEHHPRPPATRLISVSADSAANG